MQRRTLLAGLASLAWLGACESNGGAGSGTVRSTSGAGIKDIPGRLTEMRRFTELLKAARTAGLWDTLAGPGPLTLFAPTDSAFDALNDVDLQRLTRDKAKLRQVLEYHLVAGRVTDRDFLQFKTLRTRQGAMLKVTKMGQVIKINEANIDQANIGADNGIIHAINQVLMPPGLG